MFDISGGVHSLRSLRKRLDESIKEPASMWTYPVVSEKCGCGAYTETVLFDEQRAAKVFAEWRKTHGCPLRKDAPKPE